MFESPPLSYGTRYPVYEKIGTPCSRIFSRLFYPAAGSLIINRLHYGMALAVNHLAKNQAPWQRDCFRENLAYGAVLVHPELTRHSCNTDG